MTTLGGRKTFLTHSVDYSRASVVTGYTRLDTVPSLLCTDLHTMVLVNKDKYLLV